MKYAKLINGIPFYAPNPIRIDEAYIGNPPGGVYEAEGYKQVYATPVPYNPPAGYAWKEAWTENDREIFNTWTLEEITEFDDADAMQFLFGGADNVE